MTHWRTLGVALLCLSFGCDEGKSAEKYRIDVREGPPPAEQQLPYPFAFNAEFSERCAKLVEYAHRPENYYRSDTPTRPSDNPKHRLEWGSYSMVYAVTADDGKRWRRLKMSIAGARYPHPLAVFTAAHHLGFTGAQVDNVGLVHSIAPTWKAARNPNTHHITLLEEIH